MSFRIFSPGESVPVGWDLERALREIVLPRLERLGRASDTIGGYRCAVAYFSRWSAARAIQAGSRIVHPVPLAEIGAAALEEFRAWLQGLGLSARSCNKHTAAVLAILAAVDQVDPSIVRRVPRLSAIPCARARARLYFRFLRSGELARLVELAGLGSAIGGEAARELAALEQLDELGRLYRACSAASWPRRACDGSRLDPGDQWRAAVVLLATYGFRFGELVGLKRKHNPVVWRQICWQAETPVAGYHATARFGWLWYVPQKQARRKGDPLVLPLTATAAAHLRRLGGGSPAAPVFSWPRAKRALYRAWREILAAAGFPEKRDLVSGEVLALRPEHLRKTAATWLDHWRPGLASLVLGHAGRGASLAALESRVTGEHYINGELSLVEALESLPVSPAWSAVGVA